MRKKGLKKRWEESASIGRELREKINKEGLDNMDKEILEMPRLEFGPKKTDPLSLVQNFLEKKHGKNRGLEILKLMCAGEVLEIADRIRTNQPIEDDDDLLIVPELSFD
jgi:NTP pyrophosphatase (non-canonical NTP hydrolase)